MVYLTPVLRQLLQGHDGNFEGQDALSANMSQRLQTPTDYPHNHGA